MYSHSISERCDLFRELAGCFRAEAVGPFDERFASSGVEPRYLIVVSILNVIAMGESLRAMQDLIRIGVADAAEEMRIGERPLQRVIGRSQRGGELLEGRVERFDSAGEERM